MFLLILEVLIINKWTEREENFLKDNYGILSDKEICNKLNRNIDSIRYKASKLKIKKKEININDISIFLKKYNYSLLSKEYINAKTKLVIKCNTHNTVKNAKWSDIKQGKFRCNKCKSERIKNSLKTDYDIIIEEFNKRNLTLLTDYNNYINNKQALQYKCNIHNNYIQTISFDSLKRSKIGCSFCARNMIEQSLKISNDEIIRRCNLHNCIPINISDYKNIEIPILVKCKIHNNKFYFNLNNYSKIKYACPICYTENNSGENSHAWKGGTTEISAYLRTLLNDWKKKSLEKYNYRCCISGSNKKLEIHHAYPFKNIVQDVFYKLNIDIKPKICDYLEEDLNKITKLFLDISMKNLGYPITQELHRKFHSMYGTIHCTEDDFYKFIKKCKIQIKGR